MKARASRAKQGWLASQSCRGGRGERKTGPVFRPGGGRDKPLVKHDLFRRAIAAGEQILDKIRNASRLFLL
jgi:hypothetical protein